MTPKRLCENFRTLCEEYASSADAYGTEFNIQKKGAFFVVFCRTVVVEFVYRIKGDTLVPASTLYCRVFPNKARGIFIPMPEVFPYGGITEYRACVFPHIESPERLAHCFAALTEIVDEHLPALEDAFADPAETALRRWLTDGEKTDDPDGVLAGDEDACSTFMFVQGLNEGLALTKYILNDGYYFFLDGEIGKAVKFYRKAVEKGRTSPFEESLLMFLESSEFAGFVPITDECFAWRDFKSCTSVKGSGPVLLKSFLLLYAVFATVCCLTVAVINAVLSYGTAVFFGTPWAVGLIGAGLPALFGAMAFQRRLIPIFEKKRAAAHLAFDDISNSPGVYRLARVVFAVTVVIGLLFTVALPLSPLRLYETYGDCPDPASGSPFPPKLRFEYEDVECVYYISARYNDFGDRIERPSYVLLLEDGTVLDFDMAASVAQVEEKALPIFEAHGIEVIRVDSDRDVPGMNEPTAE